MTPVAVGRFLRAVVLLGLVLVGTACGGTRPVTEPDPEARYRAAIEDARTAEPSEIATSLTPLVPYNESLVWRTVGNSARQVLVVTWGGTDTVPNAAPGDTVTPDQDVRSGRVGDRRAPAPPVLPGPRPTR